MPCAFIFKLGFLLLIGTGSPVLYEYVTYNLTVDSLNATLPIPIATGSSTYASKYYGPIPVTVPATAYLTLTNQLELAQNATKTCITLVAATNTWASNMLRRMQNFTIDWRLGDASKTGKIAARNTVANQLLQYVTYNISEMYVPIYSTPYGTTAAGAGALTCTLGELMVRGAGLMRRGAGAGGLLRDLLLVMIDTPTTNVHIAGINACADS